MFLLRALLPLLLSSATGKSECTGVRENRVGDCGTPDLAGCAASKDCAERVQLAVCLHEPVEEMSLF